jgi:hypothetical protein
LASLISDRAERKWTLTITGVLIAASGLLYSMTFVPALIVIFGLSVYLAIQVGTCAPHAARVRAPAPAHCVRARAKTPHSRAPRSTR